MSTISGLVSNAAINAQMLARMQQQLNELSSQLSTGKQAQTDYAKNGFRPLDSSIHVNVKGANDPSNPFPTPPKLLTIDKNFGGWSSANTKFFDENKGIVTKIQQETGKQ